MQLNDTMVERLRVSGFDEGQLSDSLVAWLKDRTGWLPGDSQSQNDLWGLYLEQQLGHGGQFNDSMFEWLGLLGYDLSDAVSDRLHDFWSDPAPLP